MDTEPSCRSPRRRATRAPSPMPGRDSARAADVARHRKQARLGHTGECPRLPDIDHHRPPGFARTDERHQAVGAAFGPLHGTVVAVDPKDAVARMPGTREVA